MITFTNLLEKLAVSYKKQLPFVAYNTPNSDCVNAIFQKNDALHYVKDFSEEGFVFAPFETHDSVVLIQKDTYYVAYKIEGKGLRGNSVSHKNELENDKNNHIEFVRKTISFIQNSDVSKIVIARSKDIEVNDLDVLQVFEKLINAYEQATCYIWYHPKVGLWLGATPETLLEIEGASFKTMSLAGTQRYRNSLDVEWGEKEIEEQQLVTDYVLSNLKSVSSNLKNSETYTVKAGSLLHLKTDISGEIIENKGVKALIDVLHPTPAVCGFPRDASKKFILANENFERTFYTGYLGEVNLNNKTSLYVNLRCMEKRASNQVRLFVGGGITSKSNPEKEWEETVAKCQTMESIL